MKQIMTLCLRADSSLHLLEASGEEPPVTGVGNEAFGLDEVRP